MMSEFHDEYLVETVEKAVKDFFNSTAYGYASSKLFEGKDRETYLRMKSEEGLLWDKLYDSKKRLANRIKATKVNPNSIIGCLVTEELLNVLHEELVLNRKIIRDLEIFRNRFTGMGNYTGKIQWLGTRGELIYFILLLANSEIIPFTDSYLDIICNNFIDRKSLAFNTKSLPTLKTRDISPDRQKVFQKIVRKISDNIRL